MRTGEGGVHLNSRINSGIQVCAPPSIMDFRETYGLIKALLAAYTPENARHAELLALCQLDNWNRSPNKLTLKIFSEAGARFVTKMS